MENIRKNNKIMVITCTGNYRKSQFFNIVNQIATFFESDSNYKILLSDEYLSKNVKSNLSNGR